MSDVSMVSEQQPKLTQGITGIILSGGKSSRYGMNKALASFKGTTIIERVVSVMNSVFHKTILITNDPKEYTYLNLPVYSDIIKGIGPVGGIFTGLESMTDPIGFVVACDMPFLNPDLIRYMISKKSGYEAVVPKVGWKIESLHALYHRDCLPAIRENIKAGVYQAIQFQIKVRTLYIQETEIRKYDPELRSFFNINRPQELREARELVDHSL